VPFENDNPSASNDIIIYKGWKNKSINRMNTQVPPLHVELKKSGLGWSTEPAYPPIQTSHNLQEPAAAGVLSHPAERGVDISSSHQAAVTKVTHRQINIQE